MLRCHAVFKDSRRPLKVPSSQRLTRQSGYSVRQSSQGEMPNVSCTLLSHSVTSQEAADRELFGKEGDASCEAVEVVLRTDWPDLSVAEEAS